MGHRRQGREFAVQVLFQIDLTGSGASEVLPEFWAGVEAGDEVRVFAERLVRGVESQRNALDTWLSRAAEHWRVERMPVVDRNVLRLAIYELIAERATPQAVVIDEAIEIGKKFGSSESGSFINGILDTVRRRLDQPDGNVPGTPVSST